MSTAIPKHKPLVTPLGIIIALLVGAAAGAEIMDQWNKAHAKYTSVAILEIGAGDPSATQPSDVDIDSALLGITAPHFPVTVLSGSLYPAPSCAGSMTPTEFAARTHVERVPGKPQVRVTFTANNPKDAMSALNAILQNYMDAMGPIGAARSVAHQPSTPPTPPYPVAATVKGSIAGAFIAAFLLTAYRAVNWLHERRTALP
jgi:hypothetical protein